METEMGVILSQAKDGQQITKLGRGKKGPSPRAFTEHGPADTLSSGFQPPELYTTPLF